MKRLILFCMLFTSCLKAEDHAFVGKHFFASYLGCSTRAIGDLDNMLKSMDEAVKASGATILDRTFHIFEPNAITIVYVLSESHASIHTYPEYGACFVDLFTCGDRCDADGFDRILRAYLQPSKVDARNYLRSEETREIPIR